MDDEAGLSIALFSGTDDKLSAAALLTAGAAALGRKVDILLAVVDHCTVHNSIRQADGPLGTGRSALGRTVSGS